MSNNPLTPKLTSRVVTAIILISLIKLSLDVMMTGFLVICVCLNIWIAINDVRQYLNNIDEM